MIVKYELLSDVVLIFISVVNMKELEKIKYVII